ncbi:hypothetical protein POM88_003174 [Heracleum sosnowskyi]|uniref:Uncharacterized protein n=1 Tax=Heracleum sosnowskyi TaxID=360622 RepID=A0AAD8JG12_9APIA|nr:hypothetical protein POM88_003174 [Heracleum sosnowskyi]
MQFEIVEFIGRGLPCVFGSLSTVERKTILVGKWSRKLFTCFIYDFIMGHIFIPNCFTIEGWLSCDKYLINWSPKKSVFKLIITLCLPQMQEARETITFLAGADRASNIVSDAIFKAIKRGQVVPVAVLLLLARDRVLEDLSYFDNGGLSGPLKFTQSIINELASLVNQEYALMGRKEHSEILQLCLEKKELMVYLLQMLEIFDRAGSSLDLYLRRKSVATEEQVFEDVAALLRKESFILNNKDTDTSDIKSLLEPEVVQLRANLEQEDAGECPKGIWFKPHRQQFCQCGRKLTHWTCTTSNVFQRITAGINFSYSQHRDFSSHSGPLFQQPLRKILTEPTRFLSSSSKLNRKVEPQRMIRTAKEKPGMWLHLQMMSNRVAGSILVSTLKRRLRGV